MKILEWVRGQNVVEGVAVCDSYREVVVAAHAFASAQMKRHGRRRKCELIVKSVPVLPVPPPTIVVISNREPIRVGNRRREHILAENHLFFCSLHDKNFYRGGHGWRGRTRHGCTSRARREVRRMKRWGWTICQEE
jgi:hypothetical protein